MIQLRPQVLLTRSWYKPKQVQDVTQARTAGLCGSKGSCGHKEWKGNGGNEGILPPYKLRVSADGTREP